jgi:hypothetical protein
MRKEKDTHKQTNKQTKEKANVAFKINRLMFVFSFHSLLQLVSKCTHCLIIALLFLFFSQGKQNTITE